MTRRPLAPAALLAAAALAAGAGCGEDERAAYGEDFRPLSRQIVALGGQVGSSIEGAAGRTDAQLEREFDRLADQLARLRRELERLDAPEELAAVQTRLVEAMRETEQALRGIENAAAAGDPKTARRSTIELLRASADLRDARRKLVRESR